MSIQNMAPLTGELSVYLKSAGFSDNKGPGVSLRRFTRDDGLFRVVDIYVLKAMYGPGKEFDISFDLGMSGLGYNRPLSEKYSYWLVEARAERIYRKTMPAHPREFSVSGVLDPETVAITMGLVRQYCDDIFLALETPDDLYRLVRRNAEQFLASHKTENEFSRFDMWPWNPVPRLELAAVFAAFLGRADEAEELEAMTIRAADEYGAEKIRAIRANVAWAASFGRGDT